jgi:hypothetical protein
MYAWSLIPQNHLILIGISLNINFNNKTYFLLSFNCTKGVQGFFKLKTSYSPDGKDRKKLNQTIQRSQPYFARWYLVSFCCGAWIQLRFNNLTEEIARSGQPSAKDWILSSGHWIRWSENCRVCSSPCYIFVELKNRPGILFASFSGLTCLRESMVDQPREFTPMRGQKDTLRYFDISVNFNVTSTTGLQTT